MVRFLLATLAIATLLASCSARGQDVDELLQQATQASQRGEHERAITRLSEAIKVSPTKAMPWYLRGREYFARAGLPSRWPISTNTLSCSQRPATSNGSGAFRDYYAGEFAKGAKQFEDYQKYHDQDVENSVWRYLCVARASDVEQARGTLLPITNDPRVPMMQIYSLYQGKLKPADVLAAAADNPPNRELHNQRLFYAHLYIGLWHEAAGNVDDAKTHILEAEKHKIGHYMWDVAHVHAQRLRGK